MTSMLIHPTTRRFSERTRQSQGTVHSEDHIITVKSRLPAASAPAPRMDLVQRVRAAIEAGDYDDDDKLNAAIDRMLERMSRICTRRVG